MRKLHSLSLSLAAVLSLKVGDCVRPKLYHGLQPENGEVLKVVDVGDQAAIVRSWILWDRSWSIPLTVTLGKETIFGVQHLTNQWEHIRCPVDKDSKTQ